MAKKATGDDGEGTATTTKAPPRLGVATVAKPCLIGAVLLTLAHAAFGH